MSNEKPAIGRWPEPLADRVGQGASAGQVADAVVAIWHEVEQVLHPIVGHRGVAALYGRSLVLAAAAHPGLKLDRQGVLGAVDLLALKAALGQQSAAEAAAGGDALFRSLIELLVMLVGPSLTDRLLRPVWARSSGAPPPPDTLS
jgi:hypothetical protein